MDVGLLLSPLPGDLAHYDYRVHIAEVVVQLLAVLLLFWAVSVARRANATANKALVTANEDLRKEREEYTKAMTAQRYDMLDKVYMELVLLRVAHPEFGSPELLFSPNASADLAQKKAAYQNYAFALFNYLETIADKCHEEVDATADKKQMPALVETWAPILVSESWHHRFWFKDELRGTDDRFKAKFRKLVEIVLEKRSKDETIDALELIRTSYA